MSLGCSGLANINDTIACLEHAIDTINTFNAGEAKNVDIGWTLLCGIFVFFMKTGFAMLEAGGVRAVHAVSILLKNFVDTAIGGITWYIIGFAFAFGDETSDGKGGNPFIGTRYFAVAGLGDSPSYDYRHWFFQFTFAIAGCTIVSGSIAERTRVRAYFLFCVITTGWVYPVLTHWVWSKDGWLSPFKSDPADLLFANGLIDFAGDSPVHMLGGLAGCIGAWVVGPRYGRYDKKYSKLFEPHNLTFMTLGTMILWTGWYGFNAGSTQALAGLQATVAARVTINTTISATFGALTGMVIGKIFLKEYNLPCSLNGCLAGLVAITGPCSVVEPWAAAIAGITAPFIYYGSARLLEKLKIDDPIEATCVHYFCGVWGLVLVGLFAYPVHIESVYGRAPGSVVHGGLFVGHGGLQLVMQLVGILVTTAWVAGHSLAAWFVLRLLNIHRVSEAAEKDLFHHTVEMAKFAGTVREDKLALASNPGGQTEISHMQSRASKTGSKESVVVIDDDSSTGSESE